jgi:hypothetical protein
MRKLSAADYRIMPWKNGGGITTELHVETGVDADFLWRVSIADVAEAGPFSVFAGYDRHIMAIEGAGMILDGGPDGPIEVNPRFVTRSFSGDWPIASRLVSGPVRDFNLMSWRESVESSLACIDSSAPLQLGGEPGVTYFVYILEGEFKADGQGFGIGESLLLKPGETVRINPTQAPAYKIALCQVSPTFHLDRA